MKKHIEIILNTAMLIVFIWLIYKVFNELFICAYGVNYARVVFRPMGNGTNIVEFSLDTPTIASFLIMFVATLSILPNIMVYILKLFAIVKKTKIYWILQFTGFVICLSAFIYWFVNFINSAFSGVG